MTEKEKAEAIAALDDIVQCLVTFLRNKLDSEGIPITESQALRILANAGLQALTQITEDEGKI